jgi:ribonucleoside-diphosphate reductase alpha chain
MGHTTNPEIRIAKSVVDYIFRWLGLTFLPPEAKAGPYGEDGEKSSKKPMPTLSKVAVNGNGAEVASGFASETAYTQARFVGVSGVSPLSKPTSPDPVSSSASTKKPQVRDEQFASFQSDAPACDSCGAITVRNGNCYLCHNCGNSLGCS